MPKGESGLAKNLFFIKHRKPEVAAALEKDNRLKSAEQATKNTGKVPEVDEKYIVDEEALIGNVTEFLATNFAKHGQEILVGDSKRIGKISEDLKFIMDHSGLDPKDRNKIIDLIAPAFFSQIDKIAAAQDVLKNKTKIKQLFDILIAPIIKGVIVDKEKLLEIMVGKMGLTDKEVEGNIQRYQEDEAKRRERKDVKKKRKAIEAAGEEITGIQKEAGADIDEALNNEIPRSVAVLIKNLLSIEKDLQNSEANYKLLRDGRGSAVMRLFRKTSEEENGWKKALAEDKDEQTKRLAVLKQEAKNKGLSDKELQSAIVHLRNLPKMDEAIATNTDQRLTMSFPGTSHPRGLVGLAESAPVSVHIAGKKGDTHAKVAAENFEEYMKNRAKFTKEVETGDSLRMAKNIAGMETGIEKATQGPELKFATDLVAEYEKAQAILDEYLKNNKRPLLFGRKAYDENVAKLTDDRDLAHQAVLDKAPAKPKTPHKGVIREGLSMSGVGKKGEEAYNVTKDESHGGWNANRWETLPPEAEETDPVYKLQKANDALDTFNKKIHLWKGVAYKEGLASLQEAVDKAQMEVDATQENKGGGLRTSAGPIREKTGGRGIKKLEVQLQPYRENLWSENAQAVEDRARRGYVVEKSDQKDLEATTELSYDKKKAMSFPIITEIFRKIRPDLVKIYQVHISAAKEANNPAVKKIITEAKSKEDLKNKLKVYYESNDTVKTES